MKRKWLAIALSMAMAVGMLSGCGDDKGNGASNDTKTEEKKDDNADQPADGGDDASADLLEDGGGKVLNIYVWNDEWQTRFQDYYPDYKDGKIGDVTVNFIQNVNDGGVYQQKLDEALANQESASADDKVDIFLAEADYITKYISAEADVTVPMSALGITDADLGEMYDYTKQAATDENGALKGLSWQSCAAGMIYRRSLAKEWFGTDDPAAIQEQVSDWDKFEAACETIKSKSGGKGYMMSGPADIYRIFQNSDSTKYVNDGKLAATPGLEQWIDQVKKYTDAGYIQSASNALWQPDWTAGMGAKSKVFAYFGPAWFIDFTLAPNSGATEKDGKYTHKDGKDSYGDWALITGPQGFNWGGTWICCAKGTDNAALVKDILLKMTTDHDILTKIAEEKSDFVNNKTVCEEVSKKGEGSAMLGGQDMIGALKDAAETVSMTNLCPYDQQCAEQAQAAFAEYFKGKADKDACMTKWKEEVKKLVPDISYD